MMFSLLGLPFVAVAQNDHEVIWRHLHDFMEWLSAVEACIP
jgi:hypothetical protein